MNTVEASMVFTALAATVGLILGGFSTVATRSAVESLARDVARVEALGNDGKAYARAVRPESRVSVRQTNVAGQESVTVMVTQNAVLFDVSAEVTIVKEPQE